MTTIGTVQLIATIDTSSYKRGAKEIEKANSDIESSADSTEKKSNKSFSNISKVGFAGIVAASVAVGAAIISNIGNAVERIDTLISFPKVLKAMGIGADDATSATNILAKSLLGLPTSLQEGAKSVQQFVASGLDVNKATKAFLGVNNALIATGANGQDTQTVMDGLTRIISAGSGDASTLQAILSRMPTVLSALSKESGKSQQELYKLFSENPQALIDSIIRLNEKGGGGMASLDQQARDASGGIGTAFSNMNNAITRGMEGIVKAIGGGDLEAGQQKISQGITNIGKAFESALKGVGGFIKFIIDNKDIFAPIAVGIGTVIAALTAWKLATTLITVAQAIFNAVLSANPIGIIILAIAGLVAGLVYFFTQTETGKKIWEGFVNFLVGAWGNIVKVWNGAGQWFGNLFNTAWNNIKNAFGGVGKFFGDVWNNIVNIFSGVGKAIGNAVAGAFKFAVNSVLGFVEGYINTIIGVINGVIDLVNSVPGLPDIGKIGKLSIPRMAEGGIVSKATLAVIGEGKEPEAVLPLSKLDKLMQNNGSTGSGQQITQYNTINTELDMEVVTRNLTWQLRRA